MSLYQLQKALYSKLAIGDNIATEHNTRLLHNIWSMSRTQLNRALKGIQ